MTIVQIWSKSDYKWRR